MKSLKTQIPIFPLVLIMTGIFALGCLPTHRLGIKPEEPPLYTPLSMEQLMNEGVELSDCNPATAFKRGENDAKAGKKRDLRFLDLCNFEMKKSNKTAYEKGYTSEK